MQETLDAVLAGKNGIGKITKFDTDEFQVKYAAEIKDLDLEEHVNKKDIRRNDLSMIYGVIAGREALADSGLNPESWADDCRASVLLSSGIGGLNTLQDEVIRGYEQGFNRISPFLPEIH